MITTSSPLPLANNSDNWQYTASSWKLFYFYACNRWESNKWTINQNTPWLSALATISLDGWARWSARGDGGGDGGGDGWQTEWAQRERSAGNAAPNEEIRISGRRRWMHSVLYEHRHWSNLTITRKNIFTYMYFLLMLFFKFCMFWL